MMRLDVVTIFPDYFAPLQLSLIGKAQQRGLVSLSVHDLRYWTSDRHHTVDDTPYGGGAGMVMKPEPWGAALDFVAGSTSRGDETVPPDAASPLLLVPSPSGTVLRQAHAERLAGEPWLVFACGRYEGIDARVLQDARRSFRVEEVSLGDYVVNGGEVAALAIIEAVARLLPGVLGNAASLEEESHGQGLSGLLEYPTYTKPPSWRGQDVPPVLLSGHHGEVRRWRRDAALTRTAGRRPDLLAALDPDLLDRADLATLAALGWEPVDNEGGRRLGRVRTAVAD